uniref:Uncharacterized protein n=1 Tax=Kalanchoe fedtschenkoi TaxID=63787 RepID=A0A7N0TIP4_KALFE
KENRALSHDLHSGSVVKFDIADDAFIKFIELYFVTSHVIGGSIIEEYGDRKKAAEEKYEAKKGVGEQVRVTGDSYPETIPTTDKSWYFPLYEAAMAGDWENAKQIIDQNGGETLRAKIRGYSETVMHVAVGSGPRTTPFVAELLKLSTPADLEVKNIEGCTPLGIAAKVGNVEAAKLLVAKNPRLLYVASRDGSCFPIHSAAENGHREMLLYLLRVTREGQVPDPYDPDVSGPRLLRLIIQAEFYDAALQLLERRPKLATSGMQTNQSLLILAENASAFSPSGRNGGVLQPLIYTCEFLLHYS